MADAESVFSKVAKGANTVAVKDAKKLLHHVAAYIGCPGEDIVGLVAWSTGPRLGKVYSPESESSGGASASGSNAGPKMRT